MIDLNRREANTKLKALAMQHKVALPKALDAEHTAKLKKLQKTQQARASTRLMSMPW